MKIKVLFQLIIATVLLASCGSSNHVVSNKLITKRKYTKGFHFNKRGTFSSGDNSAQQEQVVNRSISDRKNNRSLESRTAQRELEVSTSTQEEEQFMSQGGGQFEANDAQNQNGIATNDTPLFNDELREIQSEMTDSEPALVNEQNETRAPYVEPRGSSGDISTIEIVLIILLVIAIVLLLRLLSGVLSWLLSVALLIVIIVLLLHLLDVI